MALVRGARGFSERQARGPNSHSISDPLDRRDELVVAPTCFMLGDDLAVSDYQHPVADPQIFELAARHQIARPSRRVFSIARKSASFDFTSTPAVGSIKTIPSGARSARAITTFC